LRSLYTRTTVHHASRSRRSPDGPTSSESEPVEERLSDPHHVIDSTSDFPTLRQGDVTEPLAPLAARWGVKQVARVSELDDFPCLGGASTKPAAAAVRWKRPPAMKMPSARPTATDKVDGVAVPEASSAAFPALASARVPSASAPQGAWVAMA